LLLMTKKTLQSVAEDISLMLSLPVKTMDSDEEVYFLETTGAQLIIGENNQVDDHDMPLASYDFIVDIWLIKIPDWQSGEENVKILDLLY